jgi:hypothetical protein
MPIETDLHLAFPLYHGTSTLFLDGIVTSGLGRINPIQEHLVLEAAIEVRELAEKNLVDWLPYKNRKGSFSNMTAQKTGRWNWQHGDTYLSPAIDTAVRYAIDKRYGSELLTYTLDFIQELVRREVSEVTSGLYQKYPDLFGWLDTCPSPLLVVARDTPIGSLITEGGGAPITQLNQLEELLFDGAEMFQTLSQQINFRLTTPLPTAQLEFYLINIQEWRPIGSRFNLYRIDPVSKTRDEQAGAGQAATRPEWE